MPNPSDRLVKIVLLLLVGLFATLGATGSSAQSSGPDIFRLDCNQPKDVAEFSVCEQSKANSISERAAILSEKQVYIAYVGFAGLSITIFISIIGNLFAFFAVKYSQKQTNILRNSLIQEKRAWIKVDIEPRGPVVEYQNSYSVEIAIKITNLGASPAFNIYTNVGFIEFSDFRSINGIVRDFANKSGNLDVNDGKVLLPGDFYYRLWVPSYESSSNELSSHLLVVCVSYRIFNSDIIHQTAFPYLIGPDDIRYGNAKPSKPGYAQFTAWGAGLAS